MSGMFRDEIAANTRPFQIVFTRYPGHGGAARLLQVEVAATGIQEERKQHRDEVVTIWGLPLMVLRGTVADLLRKNGHPTSVLSRLENTETISMDLDEESGVRLALAFFALKPLKKLNRMERIRDEIEQMSREEALYWFAKCMNGTGGRARRALRVMLAGER